MTTSITPVGYHPLPIESPAAAEPAAPVPARPAAEAPRGPMRALQVRFKIDPDTQDVTVLMVDSQTHRVVRTVKRPIFRPIVSMCSAAGPRGPARQPSDHPRGM
jgi:hypothetical protein